MELKSLSQHELLSKAIIIATTAHAGQVDKADQPYILHPLRVMAAVKPTNYKIIAVLHDVIEDSEVTIQNLKDEGFPEELLLVLDCLTRRQEEKYDTFIQRVTTNSIASYIKLADLKDNMDISRLYTTKLHTITKKDMARLIKYNEAMISILKVFGHLWS